MSDDEDQVLTQQQLRVQKNKEAKRVREQTKKLQAIQDDVNDKGDHVEIKDIEELLNRANNIQGDSAKSTKVAIKDAQINCDVAKLGLKAVKAQNAGAQQFTAKEFVSKLIQKFNKQDDDDGGPRMDWAQIQTVAALFFDATPSCHFMASDMSKQVAQKAKKAREVQQKQRPRGEETEPVYGNGNSDDVHKKNTNKRKFQLLNTLKEDNKTKAAKLIINPNSFGESVENLFAVGVMVADGTAGITLNRDGSLEIEAKDAPPDGTTQKDFKRAIIKFDLARFQAAVRELQITQPRFRFDPEGVDPTVMDDDDDMSANQTAVAAGSSR